jgi:hypothetical protein
LGDERINRVTPSFEQFRKWSREPKWLIEFWKYAQKTLQAQLTQEETADI